MKVDFKDFCNVPPRCDCVASFEPSEDPVSGAIALILVLANYLRTPLADVLVSGAKRAPLIMPRITLENVPLISNETANQLRELRFDVAGLEIRSPSGPPMRRLKQPITK